MLILTVRTDKPEAEIGLYNGQNQLAYETWHAHRELSVALHQKILDLLRSQGIKLQDLQGIVGFAGPGSFTGLRIGLTVANALAYSLTIPIVATKGDGWIVQGLSDVQNGKSDTIALPEYGSPVRITLQKK